MSVVSVLGSTGSIGQNTLKICALFPERFSVKALAAGRNVQLLAEQVKIFRPDLAVVYGEEEARRLMELLPYPARRHLEIIYGPNAYLKAASFPEAEIVVSALVGAAGLAPTWEAVKAGKKVALANKEALVLGGDLIMPLARETRAKILPVDSEHSAIFQALGGKAPGPEVHKIILTASGGPFRGFSREQLAQVSIEDTLNHPRWRMGPKVSCDSATLMNKGLELIEAHHLFGLPYKQLEVVVHPQSLVHSLVEFIDGSQIAQMGVTDMKLPIAYALSHPDRLPLGRDPQKGEGTWPFLTLSTSSPLTFEEADEETFPALKLAKAAGGRGGTAPTILNGANEEALAAFLAGKIPFLSLSAVVEDALNKVESRPVTSLDEIWEADRKSRITAREFINTLI